MKSVSEEASRELLEIGVVIRAHGVRGALHVRLHDPTSTSAAEAAPQTWRLRLADGSLREGLRWVGQAKDGLVISVEGLDDRDVAETWRGAAFCVPVAVVPLADDEYLYVDLIGCAAVEGERSFGEVVDVFSAGASDILVVRDGDEERLIPLVDAWVATVDIAARRIELRDGDAWDPQPIG